MGRIRGSNRTCPECFEQISPNNKSCYCSTPLPAKKSNRKSSNKDVKIRRTERVKRGRPDYYDILEYERQARRERKQRAKAKLILDKQINKKSNKDVTEDFKSNRMHLKTKRTKKKKTEQEPPPKEEELEEIVLSKETVAKFDLILQEINRKIYASSWRVYID